jgi:hypothetical protein
MIHEMNLTIKSLKKNSLKFNIFFDLLASAVFFGFSQVSGRAL